MIRGIILYYINIKPTHGYEIQRFIQMSGIDQWAKIQSGSIYYAIAKLEKEENIKMVAEEMVGQRPRRIYGITPKGKETLKKEMMEELKMPIQTVGSAKFITEPILDTLQPDQIRKVVESHIDELHKLVGYWKEWKTAKVLDSEYKLMELSFSMSIHSLEDQIEWHEELLKNLDHYREESHMLHSLVQSFDADRYEEMKTMSTDVNSIHFVQKLKKTIQKDPDMAIKDLDQLIEMLKNNSNK